MLFSHIKEVYAPWLADGTRNESSWCIQSAWDANVFYYIPQYPECNFLNRQEVESFIIDFLI